jgi:hypothetical protein
VSPGRAFGAHAGGPGQAHLAASLAAVPFGIAGTLAAPGLAAAALAAARLLAGAGAALVAVTAFLAGRLP